MTPRTPEPEAWTAWVPWFPPAQVDAERRVAPAAPADDILTLAELAAYLRITPLTLYRWVDKSGMPYLRIGRQYRFNRADVLA